MPTLEHNAIVDMFRERPELAPHLLALLFHVDVPPHASVTVVESSLDQLIPVEFRADLVLEVRDASGDTVLAIVVEVQRHEDPDKKFSWPVYAAVVRARMRCPTVVLVVAPDEGVAKWAARPIDLGAGLISFRPVVVGPASVPVITDPADAAAEPQLAVLSAVAHGNGPDGPLVIEAALAAIGQLDREHAGLYHLLIWKGLREPRQRALEAVIMEQRTESDNPYPYFQEIFDAAARRAELKGVRDVLLRLVARAGIPLTDDDRARIQACDDVATLDAWAENVLAAKTAADVFGG